jgi:hypothetical protein
VTVKRIGIVKMHKILLAAPDLPANLTLGTRAGSPIAHAPAPEALGATLSLEVVSHRYPSLSVYIITHILSRKHPSMRRRGRDVNFNALLY